MRNANVVAMALVSLIAAVASGGGAQSRRVKIVTSEGQPVSYAYVTIDRGPSYIADEDGELVLKEKGKSLALLVRRIGFEPWSGRIGESDSTTRVVLAAGRAAAGVMGADPSDISLAAVHARAFYGRWLQQQHGALNATFIGPEEIQARQPKLVTDLLQGVRGVSLTFRAGRVALGSLDGCSMKVLVDGDLRCSIPTYSNKEVCATDDWFKGAWADVAIDNIVSVPALAGIEIYSRPGDVPRTLYAYSQVPGCGVIAIWTWTRRSKQ